MYYFFGFFTQNRHSNIKEKYNTYIGAACTQPPFITPFITTWFVSKLLCFLS
jgi:hypothetical protein